MIQTPKEILDTILGYLGFVVEIKEMDRDGTPVLQVYTREAEALIGHHDQTLSDLQFVVNRILHVQQPESGKVIVDVEHHRDMRDDALVHKAQHLAEAVRQSGRSVQTDPLNSYDRRIVHNAFKDDPDLETFSPRDDSRVKRITIRPRRD